jgi:RNA polymerase sigma-70 factor (ECF subfamily)
MVAAFVQTLDADDRRLLDVRFVDGLSQRDAAAALGTSRQRLRTIEDRLRDRFRAFLAQRGR